MRPELPPRQSNNLPSGSSGSSSTLNIPSSGKDRRRRSDESIRPKGLWDSTDKRKLLLIYVHGFQGNEQSFRSFPAHVHNVVTSLVAETHVVHSKIYPRYRSKQHISVAVNDFSQWLSPHENDSTDVILLGHSMGGLLTAEVVLMLNQDRNGFKHRLLGTISFDVPYLGMHPGVIKAGLQSLFSPSPEADPQPRLEDVNSSSTSLNGSTVDTSGTTSPTQDPNFNPTFDNDVYLPVRTGWRNVLHFVSKHSDNLVKGTKQMVSAHLEFGGAMADYTGLKNRYARVRSLEASNDSVRKSVAGGEFCPPRIRFINYYTASTGRPKREKSPKPKDVEDNEVKGLDETHLNSNDPNDNHPEEDENLEPPNTSNPPSMRNISPRISIEEHTGDAVIEKSLDELKLDETAEVQHTSTTAKLSSGVTPTEEQRNEMERAVPGHHDEVPDPPISIPDDTLSPTTSRSTRKSSHTKPDKPIKDRKFCLLPPKDSQGNRDPAWVRVFMKDIDEVAAHCGLFIESCPAYHLLISDVSERIKEWVLEGESERLVRELSEQY